MLQGYLEDILLLMHANSVKPKPTYCGWTHCTFYDSGRDFLFTHSVHAFVSYSTLTTQQQVLADKMHFMRGPDVRDGRETTDMKWSLRPSDPVHKFGDAFSARCKFSRSSKSHALSCMRVFGHAYSQVHAYTHTFMPFMDKYMPISIISMHACAH